MPELPEVETVRRGLEPVVLGAHFKSVETRRPDLRFPLPERFAERLTGRAVLSLDRRGKYLLARLSAGESLVMHLGMTGRFTLAPSPTALPNAKAPGEGARPLGAFVRDTGGDPKHDHVFFALSNGATLTYNDSRRFGFMLLVPENDVPSHPLFRNLGPEPLGNGFDSEYLANRAAGRMVDLKAFLMDQRTVAGLGNIYVSEALHHAGLTPNRAASSLAKKTGAPSERARRLVPAIRAVLTDAICAGGSTLRDYRDADGKSGAFQERFAVYNREGEACLRPGCRGTVRRSVHGGRATYFCATCQR